MGTIANPQAVYGLFASGTPTSTKVSGAVTLGQTQSNSQLTSDIFYAVKVTATTSSDEATINLVTGVGSTTSGSPTITDGDGLDFEGVDMPNLSTIQSVLIIADSGNSNDINVFNQSTTQVVPSMEAGAIAQVTGASTMSLGGVPTSSIRFTLTSVGDSVTLIVSGKTA